MIIKIIAENWTTIVRSSKNEKKEIGWPIYKNGLCSIFNTSKITTCENVQINE